MATCAGSRLLRNHDDSFIPSRSTRRARTTSRVVARRAAAATTTTAITAATSRITAATTGTDVRQRGWRLEPRGAVSWRPMEIEELEALALGTDRVAALTALLPGTDEHDYWRGILLQHEGRLDEVDELLAGW